jgi:type IV secretory pathway component VirB8
MFKKELQKTQEDNLEDFEVKAKYNEFIKENITSGQFFKDGRDWYIFRYVNPICDRTTLIIGALILLITIYLIKNIVDSMFPLVISQPIFVSPRDPTIYQTKIVKLKPRKGEADFDQEVQTVDEAIIKYLLLVYIKDRESFDFSKGETDVVNKKFNRIKTNSTFREYKNFQSIMSKENKDSPIHFFGKNVVKKIFFRSIAFKRKEGRNMFEKALFYIANSAPLEAEVTFLTEVKSIDDLGQIEKKYQTYLAKIKYDYTPVYKNDKQPSVAFNVNQYILYKVKDI